MWMYVCMYGEHGSYDEYGLDHGLLGFSSNAEMHVVADAAGLRKYIYFHCLVNLPHNHNVHLLVRLMSRGSKKLVL